jgi:hypothetical protein
MPLNLDLQEGAAEAAGGSQLPHQGHFRTIANNEAGPQGCSSLSGACRLCPQNPREGEVQLIEQSSLSLCHQR